MTRKKLHQKWKTSFLWWYSWFLYYPSTACDLPHGHLTIYHGVGKRHNTFYHLVNWIYQPGRLFWRSLPLLGLRYMTLIRVLNVTIEKNGNFKASVQKNFFKSSQKSYYSWAPKLWILFARLGRIVQFLNDYVCCFSTRHFFVASWLFELHKIENIVNDARFFNLFDKLFFLIFRSKVNSK